MEMMNKHCDVKVKTTEPIFLSDGEVVMMMSLRISIMMMTLTMMIVMMMNLMILGIMMMRLMMMKKTSHS